MNGRMTPTTMCEPSGATEKEVKSVFQPYLRPLLSEDKSVKSMMRHFSVKEDCGFKRPETRFAQVCVLWVITVFALAPVFCLAESGWKNIGGFEEIGWVSELAVDPLTPDRIYALRYWDGLFRRDNANDLWHIKQDGIFEREKPFYDITLDSSQSGKLYLAVGSFLYLSINSGDSWTSIRQGLATTSVTAVTIDPITPTTLYAACLSHGIYKRTAANTKWQPLVRSPNGRCYVLFVDPANPQIIYAGTLEQGLFWSTDGGSTWNNILSPGHVTGIAADGATTGAVYVAVDSDPSHLSGVLHWDAGTQNWEERNTGLPDLEVSALAVDPKRPNILYVGTLGAICRSIDSGRTWKSVTDNYDFGSFQARIHSIDVSRENPPIVYAATAEHGILKSSGGAGPWTRYNAGLFPRRVWDVALESGNPEVIYTATRGNGVHKSEDGGKSWHAYKVSSRRDAYEVLCLFLDSETSGTLYAGMNCGVYRSSDGGKTWEEIASPDEGAERVFAIATGGPPERTIYFASAINGVFAWDQQGKKWLAINEGLPQGDGVRLMAVSRGSPDVSGILFAVSAATARIYRRRVSEKIWNPVKGELENLEVTDLAVNVEADVVFVAAGGSVFRSDDRGRMWRRLTSPDAGLSIERLALACANDGRLYGMGKALYRSTDGGVSWHMLASELPEGETEAFAFAADSAEPNNVYFGGEHALFVFQAPDPPGKIFKRGDADEDGCVQIGDAVRILGYLFAGAESPSCVDAVDTNDDGRVNIGDALRLLYYLFGGGLPFPPPFFCCGTDPTPDQLACERFSPCL